MNVSSTLISGAYHHSNTCNVIAKGTPQTSNTKFSREDTVEISGKKAVKDTSDLSLIHI